MEENFEPFELVKDDRRTILRLYGTEEQQVKVEADRVHIIMDAIAQGWDIDGNLDIQTIAGRLVRDEGGRDVIAGNCPSATTDPRWIAQKRRQKGQRLNPLTAAHLQPASLHNRPRACPAILSARIQITAGA